MTSFCECDTCKEVKRRIANPKCSYCGEHHDSRIHCIAEMEQKNNIQNIPKYTKEIYSSKISLISEIDFSPGKEDVIIKNTLNPKCNKNLLKKKSEYFLDVADGKYSVYQKKNGALRALRYGESWRLLTGDNLVFNMMVELIEAKEKIAKTLETIDNEYLRPEGVHKAVSILKGEK